MNQTRAGRFLATCVFVMAMMFVGGCSTVRFAYDNAHYLLVEYVDDRLDLEHDQEERLETRIREYMIWHRAELLPDYVDYLARAEKRLAEPGEPAGTRNLMGEGRELVRRTVGSVAPVAARTLTDIGDDQYQSLADSFEESNREYREARLDESAEERRETRRKRVEKQFESWIGELTVEQRSMIRERVAEWPETGPAWLEYRRARQTGLMERLSAEASAERIESYLRDWWFRRDMPTELKKDRERIGEDVNELIVKIRGSLLPRQREHLVDRIGDIRGQLASALPAEKEGP